MPRGKPSRAAYLENAKDEIKDEPKTEDEGELSPHPSVALGVETVRDDGDEVDASSFMGEDVRSSSEEREAEASASTWIEKGRLQKQKESGGRGRGAVRLRSVEPGRRHGAASASSGQEPPPWR